MMEQNVRRILMLVREVSMMKCNDEDESTVIWVRNRRIIDQVDAKFQGKRSKGVIPWKRRGALGSRVECRSLYMDRG